MCAFNIFYLPFKVKKDISLLLINGEGMPLYRNGGRPYICSGFGLIWSQRSYYLSRCRHAKVNNVCFPTNSFVL